MGARVLGCRDLGIAVAGSRDLVFRVQPPGFSQTRKPKPKLGPETRNPPKSLKQAGGPGFRAHCDLALGARRRMLMLRASAFANAFGWICFAGPLVLGTVEQPQVVNRDDIVPRLSVRSVQASRGLAFWPLL